MPMPTTPPAPIDDSPWAWLTRAAMAILLALVVARATTMEYLRDPLQVMPGAGVIPRGVGAAAGVLLDWLCLTPVILVLTRRTLDRDFRLRGMASHLSAATLAIWVAISVAWSSDRFAAMMGASHWIAAIGILWAASQLIDDWRRLRVTTAVLFGLLAVFVAHGAIFQYVELPDLQRSYAKDRTQILAERHWEEGSYAARQFENRIVHGDMAGFSASPNTFAAVLAATLVIALGLMAQRLSERRIDAAFGVAGLFALAGSGIIVFTRSKTAYVTPVLAVGALVGLYWTRHWLARHAKPAFWIGLAGVILIFGAVVAYGLHFGTLPSDSLSFRWRYWVAAWHLFEAHPLLGVGWNNFGEHYLRFRLPVAAEEIQDPHNFILRILTELGIVGGLLLAAWLGRLAWETTRPRPISEARQAPAGFPPLTGLAIIGTMALIVTVLAGIDFDQPWGYWTFELLRRGLYFCVFLVAGALVLVESLTEKQVDPRPSPWLLYGLILSAGVMLLHNLVDFSLFDTSPGAMFVFMLIAGGAVGMRTPEPMAGPRPMASSLAPAIAPRRMASWIAPAAGLAWLTAAGVVVVPVMLAESAAQGADQSLRENRPAEAAAMLLDADARSPVHNGDYLRRAAVAAIFAQSPPPRVLDLLDRAIVADPARIEASLTRARFRLSLPDFRDHAEAIVADFAFAADANPNDVTIHEDFGDVLTRLGRPAEAARQYRLALRYNDLLPADEPKRLAPQRLRELEGKVASVTGGGEIGR